MTTINVVKSFTLNHGGRLKKFEPGPHVVAEDVADHWYVRLHAEVPHEAQMSEQDGAHLDTQEETNQKQVLVSRAESLGITVDGRWGVPRLQAEIAKASR
jgi:hypothetical protein